MLEIQSMKTNILQLQKVIPLIILFCISFTISYAQNNQLKSGNYQFRIHRTDGHDIVFNTIVKDSLGKKIMYIKNGSNRLFVDSIIAKQDSVFIELPYFESGFAAKINTNGNLDGDWIKKSGDKVRRVPFSAIFGEKKRFPVSRKATQNVTGRWDVTFRQDTVESKSVGQFVQTGSSITGTFLTPYGDYRFLEGVVSGDSIYLSGFDGSYALSFTATIQSNRKIKNGKFYSGIQKPQTWIGIKNPKAALTEGFTMTTIKEGASKVNFTYPDTEGKQVSINKPPFKGKVVVIQIMGSWCPNCLDETKFMSDVYPRYNKMGVEFVGLSYERTEDFQRSAKALQPFIKNFKPPYPILIPPVAVSDPLMTEKTFPQLDKIKAFPTTIFIGKDGYIAKVHAGFDGPATGEQYEIYKKEFDEIIKKLLAK